MSTLCTLAALAALTALAALAALPTASFARSPRGGSTGGGGLSTSTTPSSTTPAKQGGTTAPPVVKLGGVLNASGDGITFTVAASGTLGQPLTISGNAPAGDAGSLVEIESTKSGGTAWTQVAAATIGSNGSFSAHWIPSANGQVALRAVIAPAGSSTSTSTSTTTSTTSTTSTGSTGLAPADSSASAASGELSTSALTIPIFKDAVATLYGPGLWGHHTACGERLTHTTIGVASRTLKCGTRVSVFYKGREMTVPVIDRGPFTTGVTWDLTMATAKALGIRETVTVGTLNSAIAPAAVVARS